MKFQCAILTFCWNYVEISLKLYWNRVEISLKFHWNFIVFVRYRKHSKCTYSIVIYTVSLMYTSHRALKFHWNFIEICVVVSLKFHWNFIEISLKSCWNLCSRGVEISLKFQWNFNEISMVTLFVYAEMLPFVVVLDWYSRGHIAVFIVMAQDYLGLSRPCSHVRCPCSLSMFTCCCSWHVYMLSLPAHI